MTKNRFDETLTHKSDLLLKITCLENKLSAMQLELEKKEAEKINTMENSEKHYSSVCHQLNKQVDELRMQLKLTDDKNKRLEFDFNTTLQKTEYFMLVTSNKSNKSYSFKAFKFEKKNLMFRSQINSLKQELEASNECSSRMKRNYEDQLNNFSILDKVRFSYVLNGCKNIDLSMIFFQKQRDEIRNLEESLKHKQTEFHCFQRELELALTPKLDERLKHERQAWEQESKQAIQRELSKLAEEKSREIGQLQQELGQEKDKWLRERETVSRLEKVNISMIKFKKNEIS